MAEENIISSGSSKEAGPVKGLSGGKMAYSNGHVTVAQKPDIVYNDDKAIGTCFKKFCEKYKDVDPDSLL